MRLLENCITFLTSSVNGSIRISSEMKFETYLLEILLVDGDVWKEVSHHTVCYISLLILFTLLSYNK